MRDRSTGSSSRRKIPAFSPSQLLPPLTFHLLRDGASGGGTSLTVILSAADLNQIRLHLSDERLRLRSQRQPSIICRYPYHDAGGRLTQLSVTVVIDRGNQPIRVEGAELGGDLLARRDFEIEDVTGAAGEYVN